MFYLKKILFVVIIFLVILNFGFAETTFIGGPGPVDSSASVTQGVAYQNNLHACFKGYFRDRSDAFGLAYTGKDSANVVCFSDEKNVKGYDCNDFVQTQILGLGLVNQVDDLDSGNTLFCVYKSNNQKAYEKLVSDLGEDNVSAAVAASKATKLTGSLNTAKNNFGVAVGSKNIPIDKSKIKDDIFNCMDAYYDINETGVFPVNNESKATYVCFNSKKSYEGYNCTVFAKSLVANADKDTEVNLSNPSKVCISKKDHLYAQLMAFSFVNITQETKINPAKKLKSKNIKVNNKKTSKKKIDNYPAIENRLKDNLINSDILEGPTDLSNYFEFRHQIDLLSISPSLKYTKDNDYSLNKLVDLRKQAVDQSYSLLHSLTNDSGSDVLADLYLNELGPKVIENVKKNIANSKSKNSKALLAALEKRLDEVPKAKEMIAKKSEQPALNPLKKVVQKTNQAGVNTSSSVAKNVTEAEKNCSKNIKNLIKSWNPNNINKETGLLKSIPSSNFGQRHGSYYLRKSDGYVCAYDKEGNLLPDESNREYAKNVFVKSPSESTAVAEKNCFEVKDILNSKANIRLLESRNILKHPNKMYYLKHKGFICVFDSKGNWVSKVSQSYAKKAFDSSSIFAKCSKTYVNVPAVHILADVLKSFPNSNEPKKSEIQRVLKQNNCAGCKYITNKSGICMYNAKNNGFVNFAKFPSNDLVAKTASSSSEQKNTSSNESSGMNSRINNAGTIPTQTTKQSTEIPVAKSDAVVKNPQKLVLNDDEERLYNIWLKNWEKNTSESQGYAEVNYYRVNCTKYPTACKKIDALDENDLISKQNFIASRNCGNNGTCILKASNDYAFYPKSNKKYSDLKILVKAYIDSHPNGEPQAVATNN